ncbi:transglycosylase SLT domain-containing protein [Aliiruegeria sabulilitoris]|uniref:transglycosylase SLT domain-containing protein n=1 Tax=Aliiruegeria sabulilitoris TaxID=1510458 RepID=UPI000832DDD4|nr:transglycosylase SLT domain-containing protein [Aliiruegeria sabulilitoris]NDR58592.1 lytic transglycosylase [Pseudoruegeria sp. M32A2M]
MTRLFCAFCILVALAGCGGGKSSPRNLDNACSIVDQRPKYLRAMKATERKWDVPVSVQMAIIHQESKFDGDARTPYQWSLGVIPMGRQSSAYGYSQALDGTWDHYRDSTGNRGAKRTNIRDATDFMGWYMNQTREKLGISLSDARNQYLAYHDGWTGYKRGTYNSKGWLLNVSSRVGERATMYDRQLRSCGKI